MVNLLLFTHLNGKYSIVPLLRLLDSTVYSQAKEYIMIICSVGAVCEYAFDIKKILVTQVNLGAYFNSAKQSPIPPYILFIFVDSA